MPSLLWRAAGCQRQGSGQTHAARRRLPRILSTGGARPKFASLTSSCVCTLERARSLPHMSCGSRPAYFHRPIPMTKQTLSFQAEVKQILHLVTHSLYSNKEIFLRELVSNASDACDKLRFEALDNAALFEDAPNLEIRVCFDDEAKTITIRDNGIGMSAEEAVAAPGHHRQERHARIHGQAGRRPEEGRQPDRPVRRRLLLRLHRRRPHHRGVAPRRADAGRRRALEQRRHGRLRGRDHRPRPSAAPTSSCTCARARRSSSAPGS